MNPTAQSAKETVSTCWGDKAPAWVRELAAFCDNEGQASVARRMKRSPSLVNMVLKNKYTGNLKGVEERFRAATRGTVICPVMGEIEGETCLDWQGKPYCGANHFLVRMYRACRNCPHNLEKKP